MMRSTRSKLLPHWGKIEAARYKEALGHSAVTLLDEEIERFYASELKKIDPGIGLVGEEFGGDREAGDYWIADPVDGTAHFIRGMPFCSTMLARIKDGQVIFGAIYDFINDVMYHAEKGKGAYKDDERIHVSARPIKSAYLGYETHLDKPENLERFLKLSKNSVMFKTVSAGWEYVQVAMGAIDGRVCFDPHGKDYDYAPGSLLVSEAGGKVANLGSTSYDFRNTDFIAANTEVFDALTKGKDALFPIKAGK